jgi:heme exporter protein A
MDPVVSLTLQNVTKRYNRTPIFSPVSFQVSSGITLAITGSNGSGKSTLLKIIANVTEPTKGTCIWKSGEKKLDQRDLQKTLGFVSPYLELYNELTAIELVQFVCELKGITIQPKEAIAELTSFGLEKAIAESDRTIKQYSSGMQQRVKLATAFIGDPKVLLLDEPSSNLDEEGIQILFKRIEISQKNGSLVIIATNDVREKQLASREVSLQPFHKV